MRTIGRIFGVLSLAAPDTANDTPTPASGSIFVIRLPLAV